MTIEKVGEGFKVTKISADVRGRGAGDRRKDVPGDREQGEDRVPDFPGLAATPIELQAKLAK